MSNINEDKANQDKVNEDDAPAMTGNEPYFDASLSIDERVNDLISRMTVREKIGQMMQFDARSHVEEAILEKHAGSILHTSPEDLPRTNELVNQTRLRIPMLVGDDLIHGYSFYPGATIFPEELGMAVSWDSEKIEAAGRATAAEAVTTGVQWTFSPVLCISRDTRWGRAGETFGEDPFLIGELSSAMIRGYQGGSAVEGTLPKNSILATAKHFAGYSETQGGRDASEADLSHRKLASWFLPPFERAAKEGVGTFMLGYESIEGVPVTLNKWLLTDILRNKWGYKGTLITDWANVSRLVWEQHVVENPLQAAVAAVKAGNDLIMTSPEFFDAAYEAIEKGLLTEAEIDEPVKRILALKFRLGLFEDPRLPDAEAAQRVIGNEQHTQLNLEVAREGVALLRNTGILPLMGDNAKGDGTIPESATLPENAKKIALIGALADDAQTQLGDWAGNSGQVSWMPEGHPREKITTIKDGFEKFLPENWSVEYTRGANIVDLVPDPLGDTYPDGQPRPKVAVPAQLQQSMIDEAVESAKNSDVAVVVVGDVVQLVGEMCSTATLELVGFQNELLDAVAATGKPMVVVLMSSKPQVLPDSALNADGLLWAPSPGMKGGQAIAEIVLGLTNPSGRLPITFPRHVGQLPVYYNQIRGQHGNRYADLTQDPAFAFGEGLGYTTFEYGEVTLSGNEGEYTIPEVPADPWGLSPTIPERTAPCYKVGDTIHAHVTVSNAGTRDGYEVVQAYISDVYTSVSWTDIELKAFKRVFVPAGQSVDVDIEIPVSELTIVDADCNRVVEPGEFEVMLGHSSRRKDLKKTTLYVQ